MSHPYKTMLLMFAFSQLEVLIVVMPVDTWNLRYFRILGYQNQVTKFGGQVDSPASNDARPPHQGLEMEDLRRQTQGIHRGLFVKQKDVQQHDLINDANVG